MDKRTEFSKKAVVTDEHLNNAFQEAFSSSRGDDTSDDVVVYLIRYTARDGVKHTVECDSIRSLMVRLREVLERLWEGDHDFVIEVARETTPRGGTLPALQQRQLPSGGNP